MMNDSPVATIDCAEVVKALWDYLDGELPEQRLRDVAAHLRDCLRCRSHAEFEQALLDRIAEQRVEHPDLEGLEARVRRAVEAATSGPEESERP